jgi:hypothetical protein
MFWPEMPEVNDEGEFSELIVVLLDAGTLAILGFIQIQHF